MASQAQSSPAALIKQQSWRLFLHGFPSVGQKQLIKHIRARSVRGPTVPSRGDFIDLPSGGSDKNGQGVGKGAHGAGTGPNGFSFLLRLKPLRSTQGPEQSQPERPGLALPVSPGGLQESKEERSCAHTHDRVREVRREPMWVWEHGAIR